MSARYEVRPLSEDDWPVLRDLRLRALADSPDAFGPTQESAAVHPEAYWRAWARGRPGTFRAFAAFEGGRAVGLVSGGRREDGSGHFGAVWADPASRGHGLGRLLVETICAFLESVGSTRIELDVTDGNPAERLYGALGFTRTGASHPLREGSELREVTMARDV
ncbi:MAG TPA: GNAT family N-acetyltransferase [Tepidiformaceae bacterium]|nr:GNAT family N-acetyltransferase [Tepidiformaceae bacterium]